MSDGRRWDKPGIPHRGWWTVDVIDLNPDEEPADQVDYATCEMCDHHPIRYVHVLDHPGHDRLEVGRICAQRMTGDYVGPRRREQALRNRAARRSKWLGRRWRTSSKGNFYLEDKGVNLGVFASPYHPGRWGARIGKRFGRGTYATSEAAKLALFEEYERARSHAPLEATR